MKLDCQVTCKTPKAVETCCINAPMNNLPLKTLSIISEYFKICMQRRKQNKLQKHVRARTSVRTSVLTAFSKFRSDITARRNPFLKKKNCTDYIISLSMLLHSYFDTLSDTVTSILPLFIHRSEYRRTICVYSFGYQVTLAMDYSSRRRIGT